MVSDVSDFLSNTPEQLEQVARGIGRGEDRRKVFEAIYHHKSRAKTVSTIAARTGLSKKRVLEEGRKLAARHIVRQTKIDGETAYEKIDAFHAHKQVILGLIKNPKKLDDLATKRNVRVKIVSEVTIPSMGAQAIHVTIDDIQSFSAVKNIPAAAMISPLYSESSFKRGVQGILKEAGEFKDWGGEKSDLYSTRLRMNGKRLRSAFAFKGPGLKGKLVIGNMGKNGDQALRLFQEEADVFIVQHWREIDSSVTDLLQRLATAKSVMSGRPIYFGTIDGVDSERLRVAYQSEFPKR